MYDLDGNPYFLYGNAHAGGRRIRIRTDVLLFTLCIAFIICYVKYRIIRLYRK